jgi:transaldolase / glucose-6-phosphate isomerase
MIMPFHRFLSLDRTQYDSIRETLAELNRKHIVPRIWDHDHTVWKIKPTEIFNRLGWLHIVSAMRREIASIEEFVNDVLASGFKDVLLLGMGGSSLAPEVFSKIFGQKEGYLRLSILDSTDPDAVAEAASRCPPEDTLYIVSSKSGSTSETNAFFNYMYRRTVQQLGAETAPSHFIAITDAGSSLNKMAQRLHFRKIFLNDPTIGGRYAALSYVGLVPAALIGVDLTKLLDQTAPMIENSMIQDCSPEGGNLSGWLGAVMGKMARQGRDKLTLLLPDEIASLGDWIEQLVAESTGKEGTGILPVVGEDVPGVEMYGRDRLFVHICFAGDTGLDERISELHASGHPVATVEMGHIYDLGAQFFLWEMATAIAGHFLNINPFDQPNVESAKVLAREMVEEYKQSGVSPSETADLAEDGLIIFGKSEGRFPAEVLDKFMIQAQVGDYVAVHVYANRSGEMDELLKQLRARIRRLSGCAVTIGYGPRFLHSTGQLHKGDAGRSLFVQLTAPSKTDLPIPDSPDSDSSTITFKVLQTAQALGDKKALLDTNRKVIRIDLGNDAAGGLRKLMRM